MRALTRVKLALFTRSEAEDTVLRRWLARLCITGSMERETLIILVLIADFEKDGIKKKFLKLYGVKKWINYILWGTEKFKSA